MVLIESEKPKKKKELWIKGKNKDTGSIDYEMGDEMPEIDTKKIIEDWKKKKEIKSEVGVENDKDDTASLGDEKGVQSGGVPLSPKERLSGKGRIHRYIRSRV